MACVVDRWVGCIGFGLSKRVRPFVVFITMESKSLHRGDQRVYGIQWDPPHLGWGGGLRAVVKSTGYIEKNAHTDRRILDTILNRRTESPGRLRPVDDPHLH